MSAHAQHRAPPRGSPEAPLNVSDAMIRKQALTVRVSLRSIVGSREFARGLNEVRNGIPFNPDNDSWDYERGRHFRGHRAARHAIAHGSSILNPKALRLAKAAFSRKSLI